MGFNFLYFTAGEAVVVDEDFCFKVKTVKVIYIVKSFNKVGLKVKSIYNYLWCFSRILMLAPKKSLFFWHVVIVTHLSAAAKNSLISPSLRKQRRDKHFERNQIPYIFS